MCVCIYIYIGGRIQVTLDITINNVISFNNLLLNLYFENLIVRLHVLNMHANFHANQMLFTIQSIILFFMYYCKL